MKRIVVDPPVSEARRERVERQLFQQLAAVRVADRAEAVIPRPKRSRAGLVYALAAAAAAAAFVLIVSGDPASPTVASPSRVVTPVGAESRFTIGREAIIDAKSDTSVEWHQAGDGAITLKLERGAVDCQVEPRVGRPPFRVVAGDVAVLVVGTRFTVTRTPSPRVDVAHGKVRIEAPGGTWFVEAGESWSPLGALRASAETRLPDLGQQATTDTETAQAPRPEIEMDELEILRKKPASRPTRPAAGDVRTSKADAASPRPEVPPSRELAKETYRIAQRLEATDPERAAAMYRAVAVAEKAGGFAASALISLAELQIYKLKLPSDALATLDEHQRRFPQAVTREEAAWFRIEAFRALGKRDEARGAAADYLREFPKGVYADRLSNGPRR